MSLPFVFRLLGITRGRGRQILLSILLGLATIACSVGLMSTSAYIIAQAALKPSIAELQVAIVAVRFFGLARGLARYLERLVSHSTSLQVSSRLRQWTYLSIEPLVPAGLMAPGRGDLLARLTSDVTQLQDFFVRSLNPWVVAFLASGFTLSLVAWWNLPAAGVLLVLFLAAGIAWPMVVYQTARSNSRQAVSFRTGLFNQIVDTLEGLPEITAWGEQHAQSQRVLDADKAWMQTSLRLASTRGASRAVQTVLLHSAVLAVLAVAIPFVSHGDMNGVLLSVLALTVIAAFEALLPLSESAEKLQADLESARRLVEISERSPLMNDPIEPEPIPLSIELEVKNLRFRYPPHQTWALDNVSFSFQQGKSLLIAGPSGAGKSTLLELLLGLWPITSGQISACGIDIDRFDPQIWRQAWATLPQPACLIGETIRHNLMLTGPDATEEDMIATLMEAQAGEFYASLPAGLDTWIGEAGLQLSGGERQRLALARALICRRQPLLLDEPTAHLDPHTAMQTMQIVLKHAQDRGAIIISHWLAGLETVDEILVLENGQITERGDHQALIENDAWYALQWRLQRSQAHMASIS